MYPRVLREVAGVGEGLVALRAFVRLRLPHVDLRVHLQVRLRTKDLQQEEKENNGLASDQCQRLGIFIFSNDIARTTSRGEDPPRGRQSRAP